MHNAAADDHLDLAALRALCRFEGQGVPRLLLLRRSQGCLLPHQRDTLLEAHLRLRHLLRHAHQLTLEIHLP